VQQNCETLDGVGQQEGGLELLDQFASIISGVVALGAGIAALWVRRQPKKLGVPKSTTSLSTYRDETGLAAPQQPRGFVPLLVVGSGSLLVGAAVALSSGDPSGWFWAVGGVVYAIAALRSRRTRSKTFRSASFSVHAPAEGVMRRGHDVLKEMGLRILSFDVETGLIEARRGINLRTAGERIVVLVSDLGEGLTSVDVQSDAELKFTLVDYGANQRNVDRFVEGVMSSDVDSV
jgi:hypothetical protein